MEPANQDQSQAPKISKRRGAPVGGWPSQVAKREARLKLATDHTAQPVKGAGLFTGIAVTLVQSQGGLLQEAELTIKDGLVTDCVLSDPDTKALALGRAHRFLIKHFIEKELLK